MSVKDEHSIVGVPICVPTQANSANLNRANTTYISAKSLKD